MRWVTVTSLVMLLSGSAVHAAQLPSLTDLKTLQCKTYNAAIGGILQGLLKAPLLDYLKKSRKDAKGVGSACAMLDYVTKTCAEHPDFTIEQAVDALIKRKKQGPPLPKVASCTG